MIRFVMERIMHKLYFVQNITKARFQYSAPLRPSGPAGRPKSFNFFFTEFHEYHQKGPNNTWNPGHKIKKICAVYIEILLWWYFGQKYSLCIIRSITNLTMTWQCFLGFGAVYSLFIFRSIADLTMTLPCSSGFKAHFTFNLQIWQKRNESKVRWLKRRHRRNHQD